MNPSTDTSLHAGFGRTELLAFVRTMIGVSPGRDDDEHPLPPGPWDPVVRVALEKIQRPAHALDFGSRQQSLVEAVFGPRPEPWKVLLASILTRHPEALDGIGGGHDFGDEVALNPQPLPPRYALLIAVAQTLVSRVELLQEFSDAAANQAEQQGIIIVGGYVNRFTDDFCGTDFRLKWPFPGPRPHWFAQELSAIDLVVMATQFQEAARQSHGEALRESLAGAASRFAEAGLARLQ